MDPTDIVLPRFADSMDDVEGMMPIPLNVEQRDPMTAVVGRNKSEWFGERKMFDDWQILLVKMSQCTIAIFYWSCLDQGVQWTRRTQWMNSQLQE
jgi:hypothetical protein